MKAHATAELSDVRRIKPADRLYPGRVLELPGRARILRSLGNLEILERGPALAVVGPREPTEETLKHTRRIVEMSAEFQMVIVSGISPGVDAAAHRAALDAGLPTIAVPGCGFETLLATDRGALAADIVEAGSLLLSPFPVDAEETQERRWWRNRIIAALCHGLVMVASEPDGGELEAHRWARQLERRLIESTDYEA
jgi:DNA processing protein